MEGLFDSLNDLFHTDWISDFQEQYGFDLSDDAIVDSVHEASEFFNMCDPMAIVEDYTTGVSINDPWTTDDDVLFFNREQMTELGITDKEGFDLILTHEIGHRQLQAMGEETNFNSYQEELCCDYMSGVRAGMNGMDVTKITESLSGMEAGETHPSGEMRVMAVEDGVRFAQWYMDTHYDNPTFDDCLEDFKNTDVCKNADDGFDASHNYTEDSESIGGIARDEDKDFCETGASNDESADANSYVEGSESLGGIGKSEDKNFEPSFKGNNDAHLKEIDDLQQKIDSHERAVRDAKGDISYYTRQLNTRDLSDVAKENYKCCINSATEKMKEEAAAVRSLQAELAKLTKS